MWLPILSPLTFQRNWLQLVFLVFFFVKKLTVDVPKLPEASHLEPEEGVIASFLDNSR